MEDTAVLSEIESGQERIDLIRKDFPILDQSVRGHTLAYLDNAATTQKPRVVIEAIKRYYEKDNSNVHRGIHELSNRATAAYENARVRAASFINAGSSKEIIFTRGTTEGINLVASSWGRKNLKSGDVILLSEMEHHSNMVPWQLLAEATGADICYIPVTGREGLLDLSGLDDLLSERVRILSLIHISNSLGTINPVTEICRKAKEKGIVTLVDAAQTVGHQPLDVQEIQCDFLAFSGHKMCGPTGIGVLYGREQLLEAMPPYQGGGEMISNVEYHQSRWNEIPHKFEAGTPNMAGAVGLYTAMDYLDKLGRDWIDEADRELADYAVNRLKELPELEILGPPTGRAGIVSFLIKNVHAYDIVTLTDRCGIALRGGHHCNQPLMRKLGVESTARASFSFYNTTQEIDRLVEALKEIQKFFNQ